MVEVVKKKKKKIFIYILFSLNLLYLCGTVGEGDILFWQYFLE